MPTWLTGLLVAARIVRSANDLPRNSQMSPVAAVRTASWSVIVEPLVTAITFASDADALEAAGSRGGRRGGGDRCRGGSSAWRGERDDPRRDARSPPQPPGRDLTQGRRQSFGIRRRPRLVSADEHRDTLGMPDVL